MQHTSAERDVVRCVCTVQHTQAAAGEEKTKEVEETPAYTHLVYFINEPFIPHTIIRLADVEERHGGVVWPALCCVYVVLQSCDGVDGGVAGTEAELERRDGVKRTRSSRTVEHAPHG